MLSILDTLRLIRESTDSGDITPDLYPSLYAKIQTLIDSPLSGKMSLQDAELLDLFRFFKKFSPNPEFEGETFLPGFKGIRLVRVGNNYYIEKADEKLERAKEQLKKIPQAR